MTGKGSEDELHGLREEKLGRLERELLLGAASPESLQGFGVEAPEGTKDAQDSCLRASAKLARLDLLFRREVWHATRADDPRRHHPRYARGRFWVRPDTTRRHMVKRIYVWTTPFGEGIRRVYRPELVLGEKIRWTKKRVEMAATYAANNPNHSVDQAVRSLEAQGREDFSEWPEKEVEYIPDGADSPEGYREWLIAIETVRRWKPNLGSQKRLELALAEYGKPGAPAKYRRLAEERLDDLERRRNPKRPRRGPLHTPFNPPGPTS
jgi:hypothetical protein